MIHLCKRLLTISLVVFITSCGQQNKKSTAIASDIVPAFLSDISSIEDETEGNPIVMFHEAAQEQADQVITLSKRDIKEVLDRTKVFKHCVITLGDHTIIRILNYDDCSQSGSWGACMPMAEGYVKRGKLVYKKDYANNIIGTPDDQERTAFLFK